MSKKQLWLAVVGLAVGVVVAYLQTDRSAPAPAPKPPVAPVANMVPASQPPRLPAAELLPPVTISAAPVAPARLLQPAVVPQPTAVSPPPAPPASPSAPVVASTHEEAGEALSEPLSGFFATADNPVWELPLLPEDGKLWTRSMYLDAKPSAADEKLSFVNKKPESDPLQTLTFTNMSDVGTQYPLIKNGGTTFLGRVAGGLSRDYAGLAEGQRIPEVLFGCQFEHQLTQRQKILGAVEYARDVTDMGRHRVRTQAAWEVLLDADKNLSLRTGILESSNKASTGEQATNLNYTVDLIWKF